MSKQLLTINRYLKLDDSIHLIEELRSFVKRAKELNPKLEEYELFDVGFKPRADFVLVKLYFYH
ncbi:hypothetical protein JCM16358_10180 [Halanaerocella petrolearia]